MSIINKIKNIYSYIYNKLGFIRFLSKRIQDDCIDVLSSSLSYTTLMSLIPVLAVLLSVFSLFPAFQEMRNQMMHFIMNNMMPQLGEMVDENLDTFIKNASKTTALGLASLVVISLALIRRIDITLNKIWHTKEKRTRITTFSIYWTVLTLGPILLGASIAITSSMAAAKIVNSHFSSITEILFNILPMGFIFIILFIVYMCVPTTKVNFKHAIVGAFVAALLQEILRRAFTFYITNFSNYAVIYGAVAALPVLMVWTYVNWYIVLLGAEISACLDCYKKAKENNNEAIENQSKASDS